MHKLDLDQIKHQGHIDLSQFIGTKTIYNALPARAKEAVAYLTKFNNRELTGTVLHDKNYKDVLKTRQQILDGTKLQDDSGPIVQPIVDSDPWLAPSWSIENFSDPGTESDVPSASSDSADQEGMNNSWLSSAEQPSEWGPQSNDPKSTVNPETIFRY